MPLYEYKCGSCGQVFEIIQKFSDTPLTVHETCGGTVERLISTSALQFKGSGWYVNDYGKGKTASEKPAGANGAAKTEKPSTDSTPKADTTPAKPSTTSSKSE